MTESKVNAISGSAVNFPSGTPQSLDEFGNQSFAPTDGMPYPAAFPIRGAGEDFESFPESFDQFMEESRFYSVVIRDENG